MPQDKFNSVFNKYVIKTDSCWIWTGAVGTKGYGKLGFNTKHYLAHRFVYENLVSKIKSGLQLDHLCRNRKCVNPVHLKQVTQKENMRRGFGPSAINSRKSTCHLGHHLSEDNLYVTPTGRRQCKKCQQARTLKYKSKVEKDASRSKT